MDSFKQPKNILDKSTFDIDLDKYRDLVSSLKNTNFSYILTSFYVFLAIETFIYFKFLFRPYYDYETIKTLSIYKSNIFPEIKILDSELKRPECSFNPTLAQNGKPLDLNLNRFLELGLIN